MFPCDLQLADLVVGVYRLTIKSIQDETRQPGYFKMIFSRRQLTHFLRRRYLIFLMVGNMMFLCLLAAWYLPYPDPPIFVYRALRADPLNYFALRKSRWLAYMEKSLGLVTAPTLKLHVKSNHMETMRKKREAALRLGLLIQEEGDFVPGTINLKDKSVKVKLRLKGDMVDHIQGETNWSYRVQTKDDEHVFGMRRFSLQGPGTRNFQYERLFFETVRLFDVMTPRYFFVSVIQNGNPLGLMAFEEHFAKELLEYHGRPESVIIRFDESLYWAAEAASGNSWDNTMLFYDYRRAAIDAFQTSKVKSSPGLSRDYTAAVGLLRGFVEGHLPSSHVFDIKRLAGFIACAHFWRSWHGLIWHNLRFYYHPVTMRLQPIVFDTDTNFHHGPSTIEESIVKRMLEDPVLYAAYRKAMNTLMAYVDDGSLTARLLPVEEAQLSLLLPESRFVRPFDYRAFQWRVEELRLQLDQTATYIDASRSELETLNPVPLSADQYPQMIQSYRINEHTPVPYLELANLLPFPVLIQDIHWVSSQNRSVVWQPNTPINLPIVLPASPPGGQLSRYHIPYELPGTYPVKELVITVRLQSDTRINRHTALSYVPALTARPHTGPSPP